MKIRLMIALSLVASMAVASVSVSAHHDDTNEYHEFDTAEFESVWERTDLPVSETIVARTWIWGPGGFTFGIDEYYEEADDNERRVQYTDKSRMEMPHNGAAEEGSPWFITQGLLAYELMSGNLQLGDELFEQHQPSNRSAAGDPQDTTAPTYAAMGDLMEVDARAGGEVIVEYADRDGQTVDDADRFAGYGVTDIPGVDAYGEVEGIDKNIASVFWDFMTSEGVIYDGNDFVDDQPIFQNAFYAVGYPLTDAFWADVTVAGDSQHVLIQCFERRCLTYTPGNPEGWEVESGNIGQHYYDWRYNQIPDEDPVDPVDPVIPTEGTFTFDGAAEATVDVDGDIVLTANVTAGDVDIEGAVVRFWVDEDEAAFVDLDVNDAVTDADGNAVVTVTGLAEGTATVNAFVDVENTGEFTAGTDFGIGEVEVTVVADDNDDNGDNDNGDD